MRYEGQKEYTSESKGYEGLVVWQRSMDLCTVIYKETRRFPAEEKFGLVSQMRRCAVSIPSNIAEGKNRSSTKELRNFLYIAKGSAAELATQITICKRLGYFSSEVATDIFGTTQDVLSILGAFIRNITH